MNTVTYGDLHNYQIYNFFLTNYLADEVFQLNQVKARAALIHRLAKNAQDTALTHLNAELTTHDSKVKADLNRMRGLLQDLKIRSKKKNEPRASEDSVNKGPLAGKQDGTQTRGDEEEKKTGAGPKGDKERTDSKEGETKARAERRETEGEEKRTETEGKEKAEREAGELNEREAGELNEREAGELNEREAGELNGGEAGELNEREAGELNGGEAGELNKGEAGELNKGDVGELEAETGAEFAREESVALHGEPRLLRELLRDARLLLEERNQASLLHFSLDCRQLTVNPVDSVSRLVGLSLSSFSCFFFVCCCCCLFVGCLTSQQHPVVYLRDGSAQLYVLPH